MPSCIPTAMYLVCPKDSTVSLSPTESTIWKTLDVVSSTPDYATTFTPVRRTTTGELEFQLKLGSNKIDISAQSRITGEGMRVFIRILLTIFSEKMLNNNQCHRQHTSSTKILPKISDKTYTARPPF